MELKLKRSALEERLSELNNALCGEKEPKAIRDYKKSIRNIKRLLNDCPEPPKKDYQVKTKFVFEGTFTVKAESKQQAREFVEKHCGLTIGRDIHSTLPSDEIDWTFDVHPKKIVR